MEGAWTERLGSHSARGGTQVVVAKAKEDVSKVGQGSRVHNGGVREVNVCLPLLLQALTTLNDHLASRTFMVRRPCLPACASSLTARAQVGEAVTLADVVLACALLYPFKLVFDAEFRCVCCASARVIVCACLRRHPLFVWYVCVCV